MRNAFGLMLASIVAAVATAGVWFFPSSPPRADAAPPQTVAPRKAEPLPAPSAVAARDDVQATAALSAKPPAAPPAPVPQKAACANPDALGVSRIVVID